MSRCKCCDNLLSNYDYPVKNKQSGQEEDMCSACRYLSFHSFTELEYVGGRWPTEGVTGPTGTGEY